MRIDAKICDKTRKFDGNRSLGLRLDTRPRRALLWGWHSIAQQTLRAGRNKTRPSLISQKVNHSPNATICLMKIDVVVVKIDAQFGPDSGRKATIVASVPVSAPLSSENPLRGALGENVSSIYLTKPGGNGSRLRKRRSRYR